MEYTIVKETFGRVLVVSVGKLIAQGWVPQGGVATMVSSGGGCKVYQAMIRKEVEG